MNSFINIYIIVYIYNCRTIGDKVNSQKGNSPDYLLRFLIISNCMMKRNVIERKHLKFEALGANPS